MPELVFLGTGASVMPGRRAHSSIALRLNGEYTILIDAGPPLTQRLWEEGISPKNIKEIYVTHMHPDHVLGLPQLLHELKAMGVHKTPLLLVHRREEERLIRLLEDYAPASMTRQVETVSEDETRKAWWGTVTFLRALHPIPTLALRIGLSNNRTIFYSSDTAYSENLRKHAAADIGIHEATIPVSMEDKSMEIGMHSSPRQALEILADARIRILTHISLLSFKNWEKGGKEHIIAYDGLRIRL